ncbi:MAG: hypothetical protein JWN98_2399 [Abditibacteriota bacterium]|nr:hypothetical protein [Abditibacteriota bacterium]
MSTITVVRKNGMAALATDSMTSHGWSKETAAYVVNHSKIVRVGKTFLGISGPSSTKLILENYFAAPDAKADFGTVAQIFETWKLLHAALKNDYFLRADEDRDDSYESSRMAVAIANKHGIFGVGSHRSVQEFTKFHACGSGDDFAMGAMYGVYDDPARSAEDVARFGVQAAIEFSSGSDVPILSHSVELNA